MNNQAPSTTLSSSKTDNTASTISKNIPLFYDRVYGFSKNNWSEIQKNQNLFTYLENYCDLIKKEKNFRFITFKPIERFSFIIGLTMFFIGLIIQQIDLGLVGLVVFISLAYFFSIDKSIKLNKLRKRFNARLKGSENEQFGMTITNKFGRHHWLTYMLLPPLKPEIVVTLTTQNVSFKFVKFFYRKKS